MSETIIENPSRLAKFEQDGHDGLEF